MRWLELPARLEEQCLHEWDLSLEKIPTAGGCVQTLLLFGMAATVLTALWFARREFHVKTPEGS